jgi:hypothetical protein
VLIPTAIEQVTGTSADDPIADMFGAPDTAFEFDTSSLTGLTAVGSSPDVEAAHTIFADHYYVERRTNSGGLMGRYAAVSAPFTAICKVTDYNGYSEFNKVAMFIGASGVVNNDVFGVQSWERGLFVHRWNASTGFSSDVFSEGTSPIRKLQAIKPPFYLAIKAASTTDVDYLFSHNGRVWSPWLRTRNPSITIALVGIAVACETSGIEVGAAFDFFRIWNSALTFRGSA